jgi:hypothetical protein
MVRRPPTDAAFLPVPVETEHGYVAPVPGFPVGALLANYAADGDVRAVICISKTTANLFSHQPNTTGFPTVDGGSTYKSWGHNL